MTEAVQGRNVLVLGAGIGGLTAAYTLLAAGANCTVVEAQDRAGGRNFTARAGTVIREDHGEELWAHTCKFDEGLYLNLGPGRIPYHHRRVLRYCQDFGVALEPYVMETEANRVQTSGGFDGASLPRRRVANDTRGRIAERLGRSLLQDGLPPLDTDARALCDLLRVFGDLDEDMRYRGSTRSGYRDPLNMYDPWEEPAPAPPLRIDELLRSRFWSSTRFYQPLDYLWQPTLFQPVGGMDKIVDAFVAEIRRAWGEDRIMLDSPVTSIAREGDAVRVHWVGGPAEGMVADYCLSSIPVPLLSRSVTLHGFSDPYREAIDHVGFAETCKVGWQANERFWESDDEQIYGGISYTDDLITQLWYPSNDYFSDKGTLTGSYNYDENARVLGDMGWTERLERAREGAKKLHPKSWTDSRVPLSTGVSIAWHKVPYQYGGWADWKVGDAKDTEMYRRLLQPDGGFHVIGDQVSPLPGWQEGAMMSAEWAIGQIDGTQPTTVPQVVRVPDSRSLTQGNAY